MMDGSAVLKPALSRGTLRCIGASTLDKFKKTIEKDPGLERCFQQVGAPYFDRYECIAQQQASHRLLKTLQLTSSAGGWSPKPFQPLHLCCHIPATSQTAALLHGTSCPPCGSTPKPAEPYKPD
jgi:hypothetical protein